MKRFFCTACQKVKRVRVLPSIKDADEPRLRTGECRWHSEIGSRPHINSRVRVLSAIGSTRKMSASAAKSKSKG